MPTSKKFRAFTLIEILVAIGIITILAVIVYASTQHSYDRGKRIRRIADIRTIQKALGAYAADHGAYPLSVQNGAYWNTQCGISSGYAGGNRSSLDVIPGLVPTYLPELPADPDMNLNQKANNMVGTCCYLYKSDGKDYKVIDFNCPTADYANPEFTSMGMVDVCRPGPNMPSFAIGVWTPGALDCGTRSPANGW